MRIILKYDSISSTNDYMQKKAKSKQLCSDDIIWATHQHSGKGQHGRVWSADAGSNLTFSLLINHSYLNIVDQFIFNKTISIAILKYLHTISTKFRVKWPNDIYINEKKIVGILIENNVKGKFIKYSTVGIGVNVNQIKFHDKLKNASSIINECNIKMNLYDMLNKIYDSIMHFMDIMNKNPSSIESIYQNNLYKKGVNSSFMYKNEIFDGVIKGVDKFGKLNIELDNKNVASFVNGEIQFLSKKTSK